jgi:hypothetical protein
MVDSTDYLCGYHHRSSRMRIPETDAEIEEYLQFLKTHTPQEASRIWLERSREKSGDCQISDQDVKDFLATNGGGEFGDMVDAKMRNKIADGLAELKLASIILAGPIGFCLLVLFLATGLGQLVLFLGFFAALIWSYARFGF